MFMAYKGKASPTLFLSLTSALLLSDIRNVLLAGVKLLPSSFELNPIYRSSSILFIYFSSFHIDS